jgi:diguanylate cyclase (GGDEF)-like protein
MPAAISHRTLLLTTAAIGYLAVFAAFLLFEVPGLGVGHFYYVCVALVALSTGPAWGAGAGVFADCLYALGIVLNPSIPSAQVLSTSTGIRFVTFSLIGALIGWFAKSNRKLVEHLRTAADRDFLTDLLNTRAFDGRLEARLELGRPFGLLLCDMDGLKEINDHDGHAVGNDVLRRAGEVIARVVRDGDEVARVGGDEFAVLTQTPGTDAVRALCSRLTNALAAEGIGMSFGWGVHPRDGNDALALFRAADERLYAQKLIRRRLTGAEIVQLPTGRESFALRSIR